MEKPLHLIITSVVPGYVRSGFKKPFYIPGISKSPAGWGNNHAAHELEMNYLIIAASFAAIIISHSAYGESHLATEAACPDGEKIYFSCKTKRSKLISLCAMEVNGSPSSLTYFFGRINNPELTQTALSENHFEPFRFNHYFRYGTNYFRVSFVRGGYRYEIYKDYDMEEAPVERSGVIVSSAEGASKEVDIECSRETSGDLSPLSSILKCDKDNALGCAN